MILSFLDKYRTHLTAGALLLMLYGLGIATGIGLSRIGKSAPARPQPPPHPIRGPHFYAALGLDPAQKKGVEAVFEKYHPELAAVLDETYPRVRAIQERMDEEIAGLLRPDQKARLEELRQRRSRGRHRRSMRPGDWEDDMYPADDMGPWHRRRKPGHHPQRRHPPHHLRNP